jgi:carboxylesterase
VPIVLAEEAFAAQAEPSGPEGMSIGVLLSHGFTGAPSSMRPWARHLHQQGFTVSVPLLPGHGTRWEDMNATTFEDWYGEVERAFEKLQVECDLVFVAGLSMGGALALNLAVEKGRDVAGIILVNPAVATDRKDVKLLPVLKHLVACSRAIGSDIKKPGVVESAYPRTPLKAAHSYFSGIRALRERLPEVTQPMLMFRSRVDHVVDPSSGRIILSTVSSRDVEERVLEDSYHVATLDNDAPLIYDGSAEFIRRVAAASPAAQPPASAPGS